MRLVVRARGKLLLMTRSGLLYAGYPARRFDGRPPHDHVVYHSFAEPAWRKRLYSFPSLDPRSQVRAIVSPDLTRLALFVRDGQRNRHIVVYDTRSRRRYGHIHSMQLSWPRDAATCFSRNGDYLMVLERQKGKLKLVRVGLRRGNTRLIAAFDGDQRSVRNLGVLKDNRTVWLHLGDQLLLVRLLGRHATTPLRPLAHLKAGSKARFTGRSYWFDEPQQLLLELVRPAAAPAKSPRPYFTMVPIERLKQP
jgi:hypothetical protein